MAVLDQIQSAGSIGMTQRPKQRVIDKILMKNRDQKEQEVDEETAAPMPTSMRPSGAALMGMGPGTNIFGGQGAFNRPNTLALMLGGGGK